MLCLTAQSDGQASDGVLLIFSQTIVDDQSTRTSWLLPMGSLYELAKLVLFEIIVFGAAPASRKVVRGGQE
ncbi:MAG TPA: hypothetical protein VM574_04425 [Terrimicrobiaceae bacterium]|nr:hypothetical protein [Terrimicrobiaceae bacterium]